MKQIQALAPCQSKDSLWQGWTLRTSALQSFYSGNLIFINTIPNFSVSFPNLHGKKLNCLKIHSTHLNWIKKLWHKTKVFMRLPLTSGRPDRGSDGVCVFTNDDVRGRVVGFVGYDSVLGELVAWTVKVKQTCLSLISQNEWASIRSSWAIYRTLS